MQKAIIVISGTPSGKGEFDKIAKEVSWIWNLNPKDFLGRTLKNNLYWIGEGEEKNKTLSDVMNLLNKAYGFEWKYLDNSIEKFLADDSETKIFENKQFDNFLLVIHGMSRDLVQPLEDKYGAFQLHITSRSLNTNVERHDYVLYEDDEDFIEKTKNVINVLTQKTIDKKGE